MKIEKIEYMGNTTYIQVNSLDNGLFIDEYAEPVFSMLDKYVFYGEEELKVLAEKDKVKSKEKVDFIASKIEQGVSLRDAFIDYAIKEYKEMAKNNESTSEVKGYFERI